MYGKLAVHHGKKLCDDGDTQPRPLDIAVSLFVKSDKRLVKLINILVAYADTRVDDRHVKINTRVGLILSADKEGHGAFFRILHGISQQIGDYLPYPHIVSHKHGGQRRVYIHAEVKPVSFGSRRNGVYKIVDYGRGLVFDRNYLHLAVLDLRKIEYAVYKREQSPARALNIVGVFSDNAVRALAKYHLVHTQNGIDRRAYLVGHLC